MPILIEHFYSIQIIIYNYIIEGNLCKNLPLTPGGNFDVSSDAVM